MSEIPEDIDILASRIVRGDYMEASDPEYAMYRSIAEALHSERERHAGLLEALKGMLNSDEDFLLSIDRAEAAIAKAETAWQERSS